MVTPPGEFQRFQRGGASILRLRPAWGAYWRAWIACGGVIALWLVQRQLFDGLSRALGFPAELSVLGVLIGLAPMVCHRNSGPMNLLVSALKEELRHGEKSQTGRDHCEAA